MVSLAFAVGSALRAADEALAGLRFRGVTVRGEDAPEMAAAAVEVFGM